MNIYILCHHSVLYHSVHVSYPLRNNYIEENLEKNPTLILLYKCLCFFSAIVASNFFSYSSPYPLYKLPVERAILSSMCQNPSRNRRGDEEPCMSLYVIISRWRYRCRAVFWLNKCSVKTLDCAMNKFDRQEHIFNIYQVKFKNNYFRYECKLIDLFLASGMSIICFLSYRNLSPTFKILE